MKKEIMELWVAALRSGEYKQGKFLLRDKGKYCCLGVLCEISAFSYSGSVSCLPDDVKCWAGMRSNLGHHSEEGFRSLSVLNDFGEKDFNQIADFIEENYEKL